MYDAAEYAERAADTIRADVRMVSGCEDKQTSADVSNVAKFELPDPAGRAGGACTSALLNVLYKAEETNESLSFVEVLRRMRTDLQKSKFSQNPQLSSSRNIDLGQPFRVCDTGSSGTKRAVLVGINYVGQSGQLSGCHNDVGNIRKYLMNIHGYEAQNIQLLLDDGKNTNPTGANIRSALQSLVKDSKKGDSVFFHYSGHGGNLPDDNGDEEDGMDETLIPVDYVKAGQIRDDELLEKFIVPMQAGVTVTCLMDACHSGSILDLPYMFVADGASPSNSTPVMKPNAKFDYSKVAGVAMKVLPAAMRAYQAAKRKGDPCSALMAFGMALMPLIRSVGGEMKK